MSPDAPLATRLHGLRVLGLLNGHELFGHERGNIEVFQALLDCGARVRVGTSAGCPGGSVESELIRRGMETFPVPFGFQWSKRFFARNPLLLLENIRRLRASERAMASELQRFEPTHVHVGSALAFSFIGRAIRKAGVPLVVRLGDAPPTESTVQMVLWRRFLRASRSTVAISRFIESETLSSFPSLSARPMRVIHNLAPTRSSRPARAPFDHNCRHVVYCGQIARGKGIYQILDAAMELSGSRPRIRFHLVGGSKYGTDTERDVDALIRARGLSGSVRRHGWIDNPRDYLARADLHIAPSIWDEALGNVVLEAKAVGTPSIVFPSGGLPELIRHQVDGFICVEPSPSALADGIEWLLDLGEVASSRMRAAAAQDGRARFGRDRFRDAWAEVYLESSPRRCASTCDQSRGASSRPLGNS